jgi:hypothetical protein
MSELPVPSLENESPPPGNGPAPRPIRRAARGFVWPMILVFVGVVLLLNTTGVLPWWVWERLCLFWPVILILWGIDLIFRRQSPVLRLVIGLAVLALLVGATIYLLVAWDPADRFQVVEVQCPLDGSESGEVILRLMVGRLEVQALRDVNAFAQAEVEVENEGDLDQSCRAERSIARLNLSDTGWRFHHLFTLFQRARWQVALTPKLPLDLSVEVDVGDGHLDLHDLRAETVTVQTHVGEVEITLPSQVERGQVLVTCDVGRVLVTVPQGVAVRIEAESDVGSVSVDKQRFPRVEEGVYQSPDYENAAYRVDLEVEVSVGSITVN